MCKVEECVAGVAEFNAIAGNYEDVDYQKLLSQARVVKEEGLELYAAVNDVEGDYQLLKECVDVLVVAHGFAGMLQHLGYDVYGAWKATNENNLSKFPSSQTDAYYTKMAYEATGETVEVIQHNSSTWVVKDSKGKVRKPIGYQPVELDKYLPSKEDL